MLAVTSGTDSRTLLAASKEVRDKVYYFINKERDLKDSSPDIAIPRQMFERIQVPFHIHDVPEDMDPEFRRIFIENTFLSSDRILPTIYNVYFKEHSDKINVLGVGEIGRALWGREPKRLTPYFLAYSLRFKNSRYATEQCQRWLREVLPHAREYGIDIMTLLLWEQLLGNWGAVGNSESDIAIEEFDPYDSHFMYETLLGVDESSIKGDRRVIFTEMLCQMWPELNQFPINPPSGMRKQVVSGLKRCGLFGLIKQLRFGMNCMLHKDLSQI
jgi:hypothetical protein